MRNKSKSLMNVTHIQSVVMPLRFVLLVNIWRHISSSIKYLFLLSLNFYLFLEDKLDFKFLNWEDDIGHTQSCKGLLLILCSWIIPSNLGGHIWCEDWTTYKYFTACITSLSLDWILMVGLNYFSLTGKWIFLSF